MKEVVIPNTHKSTLQSHNKLSRRAKMSYLVDTTSKVLLEAGFVTLESLEVESDTGNLVRLDSTDAKTFLQESLSLSLERFSENSFNISAMPLI